MLTGLLHSSGADNAQQEPAVEVITFEVEGDRPFKSAAEISQANAAAFPRVFEENYTKDEQTASAVKVQTEDSELSVSAAREALSKKLFAFSRFEKEQDLPSKLSEFRQRLDVLKSRLAKVKPQSGVTVTPHVLSDIKNTQETVELLVGAEDGRPEESSLLGRHKKLPLDSADMKTTIEIYGAEHIGRVAEEALDRHENELAVLELAVGVNRRVQPYQFELDGYDVKRALTYIISGLETHAAGKKDCEKMCTDIRERYNKFCTNMEKNSSRLEEVSMNLLKYKQISEAHSLTQSCLQYENLVEKCLHLYRGFEKITLNKHVARADFPAIDSRNRELLDQNSAVLKQLESLSTKMKAEFAAVNALLTEVESQIMAILK